MKKETTYNYTADVDDGRKMFLEYSPLEHDSVCLYVGKDLTMMTLKQADHLYRFLGNVLEDIARQKDGE